MTSTQTKGMCIATRCTSVEQFIQMFHRFVDEESFFVSTNNTRPAGLETAFSVNLADGTPVLRGHCVVMQSWAAANSPFRTPGVRLGIKRLTASSMHVFELLLITRDPVATAEEMRTKVAPPPTPKPVDAKSEEQRTPGSELVLPANPLSGINDVALEGFVDCTLYEETGNFFPVEEELTPPIIKARTTIPPPLSTPATSIVNVPLEMSVLAPLPRSMPSIPPPLPAPAVAAVPPPLPYAATVIPPPMPSVAVAPPRQLRISPKTRMLGLVQRLPPRRYLAVGGFAVIAVATVAIAASGSDDPPAKPTKVLAQLETDKPAPVEPEPPPAPPTSPTPPATTPETPDGEAPTNEGPTVIGDGPCKLAIATTPAGSMVSLDGKVLAPSPLTLATSCEKHKIDIAHARYMTSTKFVSLAKPEDKLEVTLGRPTHTISVTSTPSGATIFIDGHRAGTTPTTLSVMGFQQVKLEVKKSGYQPMTTKIYSKVPQDKVALRLSKW